MQLGSRPLVCLAWLLAACASPEPEREDASDPARAHDTEVDAGQHHVIDAASPARDAEASSSSDASHDAALDAAPAAAPDATAQRPSSDAGPGRTADASVAPIQQSWPTSDALVAVDVRGTFPNNLSALGYEPAQGSTPARVWALQNEPPALFRLLWDGTAWKSDAAEGWGRGKAVHFPNGGGRPDSEGLALLPATGNVRFVYMASERDTDSAAGRQSVLRFDVSGSAASLTATHEWNLTSAIPATALNAGLEAIAFVPDSALAELFDESRMRTYEPGAYAEHAAGLFFVGVEATGAIHAFLLDHAGGAATRVATISSGLAGVMALEYDNDSGFLWAHCDQVCDNRTNLLALDRSSGRFVVRRQLAAPPGSQALGNEGLALTPDAECNAGKKPIFWAEDAATDGRAIRRGTVPCADAW